MFVMYDPGILAIDRHLHPQSKTGAKASSSVDSAPVAAAVAAPANNSNDLLNLLGDAPQSQQAQPGNAASFFDLILVFEN
jgi:hypothetical protein